MTTRLALLDRLGRLPILQAAWKRVAAKRGTSGIDRVTHEEFAENLSDQLRRLRDEIRAGAYRPLPVLRIRPRFLAASDRALVIPTLRDRVVQRAISDLLQPLVEPLLSPACRAFRPGSSAKGAAEQVGQWVAGETPWVLRADVRAFFDSIDRELLLQQLEPWVDSQSLRFLGRILRSRSFDAAQPDHVLPGIAQGSPLSPLLANLYLADLDHSLLASHPRYLRYCDDLIVLAEKQSSVEAAQSRIEEQLAQLHLELNRDKSRICRAEDGFVFLGFHFGPTGRGPAVKAVKALTVRLDQLRDDEPLDLPALDALFRGWSGYYGEQPQVWAATPTGLLAFLRSAGEALDPSLAEELTRRRWRQPQSFPPRLALHLAQSWWDRGCEEQAWLELIALVANRKTALRLEGWADLLAIEEATLTSLIAQSKVGESSVFEGFVEALSEQGQFDLAQRLTAFSALFATANEPAVASQPSTSDPSAQLAELDEADLGLLHRFFQGREGVHAALSLHGHRRAYTPVPRPITSEDWQAHLEGERVLALPLVRAGNTVLLGVLDVDVERRALDERLGVPDELMGRALATALRLRTEFNRRGADCLLEASGYKGYHLWVRFAAPVPCLPLRRWLLEVARSAQPWPEGIRVEEFPNRDRVREDRTGPHVKLPLGSHPKSGRASRLLDSRGQPVADPFEAIRGVARVPVTVLENSLRSKPPGAASTKAERSKPTPPTLATPATIGERARKILDGCGVLGYLEKRAMATSYLTHRERTSLLCVLGHLGDEGRQALHAIIGHTYNYQGETTDRHAKRMPSHPISCPKLRELHPEAASTTRCDCPYSRRGAYPTPLLLALKPNEIPVFRTATKNQAADPARKNPPPSEQTTTTIAPAASARPATSRQQELIQRAEHALARIRELEGHRRGILASLRRSRRDLAQLFDEAGSDTLTLPAGNLRRHASESDEGWKFQLEI